MIHVTALHNPIPGTVDHVVMSLSEVLQTPVVASSTSIDVATAYDARRQQYSSTRLLELMLAALPQPDAKLVAITEVDLFVPVLTFVFGEAQLGGSVAIASSHRLCNTFYGMPPDRFLLMDRLVKEVVHELGHAYNLIHCRDYRCVMHASTSVEGVDLKDASFCRPCRGLLREAPALIQP